MARDRFISISDPANPYALWTHVKEFFGEDGFPTYWENGRLFIDIPGVPFDTVRYNKNRFVEIWRDSTTLSVITRQHDPFVNSIADGLARFLAMMFKGELQI